MQIWKWLQKGDIPLTWPKGSILESRVGPGGCCWHITHLSPFFSPPHTLTSNNNKNTLSLFWMSLPPSARRVPTQKDRCRQGYLICQQQPPGLRLCFLYRVSSTIRPHLILMFAPKDVLRFIFMGCLIYSSTKTYIYCSKVMSSFFWNIVITLRTLNSGLNFLLLHLPLNRCPL